MVIKDPAESLWYSPQRQIPDIVVSLKKYPLQSYNAHDYAVQIVNINL